MKNLENSPRHPYAKHIKHVSRIAMKIGFIVSIGLCILAFNWTTYDMREEIAESEPAPITDEVYVIRTPAQKKRTPPPPVVKPSTEIITDDLEFEPEPEPKLMDEKVIYDDTAEPTDLPVAPVVEKEVLPPSPLVEVETLPEESIYVIVEEMPRFVGCEEIEEDKEGRRLCADGKFLQYIYSNIKYPPIARENKVEGLVVIQFVVGKDGNISKVQIAKDIGAGCGKEAARVIKGMPNWIPGRQRTKAVSVRYNIPVKFKLR